MSELDPAGFSVGTIDADGWVSSAQRLESPNFDARPPGESISLLIIHAISLPPGEFGGDSIERLFLNSLDNEAHPYFATLRGLHVSAHFLIRRDGALVQFVSCLDRAWHAGVSLWQGRSRCNDFSIGIGSKGVTTRPSRRPSTIACLPSLPHCLGAIRSRPRSVMPMSRQGAKPIPAPVLNGIDCLKICFNFPTTERGFMQCMK